jgi:hypothetical protein
MTSSDFQPPVSGNKVMITWVNGVPEPTYGKIVNTQSVKKLASVAASLPYEGEWDPELEMHIIEPRFKGLTNIEVMWIRLAEKAASGDTAAMNMIFDRILGKPKQSVESASVSMTYQEFLQTIAQQEVKNSG